MSAILLKTEAPGLRLGRQPEKTVLERSARRSRWATIDRRILSLFERQTNAAMSFSVYGDIDAKILKYCQYYQSLSPAKLLLVREEIGARSQQAEASQDQGERRQLLQEQIALVNFHLERCLGLNPRKEQRYACWLMRQGFIIEMQTGEGKTLCSAMTAAVVSLSGTPVHIMTVNDYLVGRDARLFDSFYKAMGISSAIVLNDMDEQQRRTAYRADVVYVTAKQIVFDYLRDGINAPKIGSNGRIADHLQGLVDCNTQQPLLRGLCFAILDEIDSILIDEARTPLVIATDSVEKMGRYAGSDDQNEISIALGIARLLHNDIDFTINQDARAVQITEEGLQALRKYSSRFEGVWKLERFRNERVRQALIALNLFRVDKDYIIKDGQIVLIDESTGRTMPDQRLQNGLHQFVEVRERCDITPEHSTQASISFQSFFNRYRSLVGMSGTVKETATELRDVYALDLLRVPTHKASKRISSAMCMFQDRASQDKAMLQRVTHILGCQRAVLLGTRSVAESERTSTVLREAGIKNIVLNARQNQDEAAIIAKAGHVGMVTVATNMAGRGTDIALDCTVLSNGGLHIISLSLNDSFRIDRQLYGRCARQGDPGSAEILLSLDDELIREYLPKKCVALLKICIAKNLPDKTLIQLFSRFCAWCVQEMVSRRNKRLRYAVHHRSDYLNQYLAFGGKRD